jgi:signal transduction histidine kinase
MTSLLVRLLPGGAAQPEALAKRRLMTGLTIILIALLLQTVPLAVRYQQTIPILFRFGHGLVEMLVLAALLSAAQNAMHRRRAGTAATLVAILVVAAIGSELFALTAHTLTRAYPLLRIEGPPRTLAFVLGFGLFIGLLYTGVWALAFVFPYVAEDARLRALEADKLRLEAERLRVAAELARLRSQLEPHFLLNTLNAIAGFVTENPREARRLIACLGDLLRDSLEDGEELQPLANEIAWLRRYAAILESRHAGALAFEWEIEPGTERALLPRLLLQPLVENAVKHGALRRRGGGVVRIVARAEKGRVVCVVEDNGPGLPETEPRAGAFGLRSVRRRLEIRFPEAKLRLESSASGARAIVELPIGSKEATLPLQLASEVG